MKCCRRRLLCFGETSHLQSRPITLFLAPIDRSEADGSIAANITAKAYITRSTRRPKFLPVQPRPTTVLQPTQQSRHQKDLPPFVPYLCRRPPSNNTRAVTRHQKSQQISHALYAPPPAATRCYSQPSSAVKTRFGIKIGRSIRSWQAHAQ